MRRIRHQVVAAQMTLENPAAGLDGLLLGHVGETQLFPRLGQGLDDEGRGVVVELIDMRPDPAMLGPFEDEGEGVVEFLMRA